MNLFDLSDGTYVLCKELPASEFTKLFQSQVVRKLDSNFSTQVQIYEWDGKFITELNSNYIVFESVDDIRKVIKEGYFDRAMAIEIMYKKNPYQDKFPDSSLLLARGLLKELHLENENFDFGTLGKVQSKISQMEKPYHFIRRNFINLIALIGETIRSANSGIDWYMHRANDHETWNPYLIKGDKKYAFFVVLYEQIFHDNNIENVLLETAEVTQSILR